MLKIKFCLLSKAIVFFQNCFKMDAISMTAEAVGWTIQNLEMGLQVFLEYNYYTVAYLMSAIGSVADTCEGIALSFYLILRCYFNDFLTFSNELAMGVLFVSKIVANFLIECSNYLHLFCVTIADFIHSLYISIINLSNITIYFLTELFENLVYFAKLIFEAILLILQLGPNILIFVYKSLIYCCSQLYDLIQHVLYFIWENLYQLPSECQKLIVNIPPKAYFGIFLLICTFYSYNRIKTYMKSFYNFTSQILLLFINHMSHLIFKCVMIIVKFFIRIASYIGNFSLFNQTRSNSMSSSGSHNPGCSSDNTHLTVKCMKKTVRLLGLPFRKIKEELNEEQIELLQRELSEEKMRRVCIICHDRERNVLLYPCRHMIMCEECTIALQENYQDCPLCRHEILNTLVVYT